MANEIMKVENLELNHEYKNWKEVCKVLEIEVLAGNSKKAQLAKLNELTAYQKKGYKFIFTEIKKLDIISTKKMQPHSKQLQLIILNKLLQSYKNNRPIHDSLKVLLKDFSLVNSNYDKYHYNQKELSKILDVEERFVNEAYIRSYDTLRQKVEGILNKLKNEWFIIWDKDYYIGGKTYTDYTRETGTIRQSIIDSGLDVNKVIVEKFYRRMTDDEKKKFVGAKERVGHEMGFRNEFNILISGKWVEFSKKVCLELSESLSTYITKMEIFYFHTSYNIYINDDMAESLDEKIKHLVFDNPDEENKKMLMLTYDSLMKNTNKLIDKANNLYNDALETTKQNMIGYEKVKTGEMEFSLPYYHRNRMLSKITNLRIDKKYHFSNEKILNYVINPIDENNENNEKVEETIDISKKNDNNNNNK